MGSCYHHKPSTAHLRSAFPYLPSLSTPSRFSSRPVLSCPLRLPSLTPSTRARACPVAASARRIGSKTRETLPPSLPVLVTSVNVCTWTCTPAQVEYQEVPAQYLFLAPRSHILLLFETRTRFSSFHHRGDLHLITESSRSSSREPPPPPPAAPLQLPASVLVLARLPSLPHCSRLHRAWGVV